MIKKYVLLLSIMLIILLFTTNSNASYLSFKQRIYEKIQENSAFQKITDIISNITSYNVEVLSDEDNTTIDTVEEETTLNDESTVDEYQENKTNLQRIIEIITQHNEKFGTILQRIVENVITISTIE